MQDWTLIEVLPETTPSADGTLTIELGTRPKAGIALRVSCLNNAAMASFSNILGAIEDIRIELHGSAIIQLNGADLAALGAFLLGRSHFQTNVYNLDNSTRSLTLWIPFGIGFYDPDTGLWETASDEAKMEVQFDIADTGYDGLILNAAALEIPDAKFTRCLSYTTMTHTPTATGNSDADLPRVYPTIAYLLRGTTVMTGTAWTSTIDKVSLLENRNPEKYLENHFELLQGLSDLWAKDYGEYNAKVHLEVTLPADTDVEEFADPFLENYIWMTMCPDGNYDDPYDPSGLSDLKLRVNAGDTNAIRIIPVEYRTPRR